MKECPKCGYQRFITTQHVMQDILVDEEDDYIETRVECVAVSDPVNNNNIWVCDNCGYMDEGNKFEID